MAKGEHIRVVLCDDVEPFRALMRFTLTEDPAIEVVGEAEDGETGVARVAELQPDVVLLDLSMPRCDGIAALPRMLAAAPHAAIVVLSGFDAAGVAATVIECGAYAYLEKGADAHDIRAVVHGAFHNARAAA